MHFIFGEKCAHFNALYFYNERAEQVWSEAEAVSCLEQTRSPERPCWSSQSAYCYRPTPQRLQRSHSLLARL